MELKTYRIEGPGFSAYVKGTSPEDAKRRLRSCEGQVIDEHPEPFFMYDREGDEVQFEFNVMLGATCLWTVEESE